MTVDIIYLHLQTQTMNRTIIVRAMRPPRAYKKKKAALGATLGIAGASALGVAAAALVLL